MPPPGKHRRSQAVSAAPPWEDVLLPAPPVSPPPRDTPQEVEDKGTADAVRRFLQRRARRASGERRPLDIDTKTANLIRMIGDWDPATGKATGMLGQCAGDPSVISALRELHQHLGRVYMLGFAASLESMKAKGEKSQSGGQEFGYGSLGILAGVSRSAAQQNVNKGKAMQDQAREDLGVAVLRTRRAHRIRVAGLAKVLRMPTGHGKAAGE